MLLGEASRIEWEREQKEQDRAGEGVEGANFWGLYGPQHRSVNRKYTITWPDTRLMGLLEKLVVCSS